jgi:hypothetical protein
MLLQIPKEKRFSEIEVVVILTGIFIMSLASIYSINVPMLLNCSPAAASYVVRLPFLLAILALQRHHQNDRWGFHISKI